MWRTADLSAKTHQQQNQNVLFTNAPSPRPGRLLVLTGVMAHLCNQRNMLKKQRKCVVAHSNRHRGNRRDLLPVISSIFNYFTGLTWWRHLLTAIDQSGISPLCWFLTYLILWQATAWLWGRAWPTLGSQTTGHGAAWRRTIAPWWRSFTQTCPVRSWTGPAWRWWTEETLLQNTSGDGTHWKQNFVWFAVEKLEFPGECEETSRSPFGFIDQIEP